VNKDQNLAVLLLLKAVVQLDPIRVSHKLLSALQDGARKVYGIKV
jgi:hypothetical protein